VLLPPSFERQNQCRVDVIAVGTALPSNWAKLATWTWSLCTPASSGPLMAAGFGVNRRDVMYNDFVILGPAADPAKVHGATTAVEAMRRIATAQALSSRAATRAAPT